MDWLKVAAQVAGSGAKLLGGVLGGPMGAKVGGLVASALGVDNTPDAVSTALQANPDAFLKLKELESNQHIELEKLALQEYQAQLGDVQGARGREVEVVKATGGKKDWMLVMLGCVVTVGFLAILFLMAFTTIPEGNKDNFNIMLGFMGAAFTSVVGYYFGSSHGSARKTEMMAEKENGNG